MEAPTRAQITELISHPKQVARELRSFQKAARVLSSDHPRLIDRYPNKWVAVHGGKVQATGKTLQAVMTKVEKKKLPRERVLVRYIDRTKRTLIL